MSKFQPLEQPEGSFNPPRFVVDIDRQTRLKKAREQKDELELFRSKVEALKKEIASKYENKQAGGYTFVGQEILAVDPRKLGTDEMKLFNSWESFKRGNISEGELKEDMEEYSAAIQEYSASQADPSYDREADSRFQFGAWVRNKISAVKAQRRASVKEKMI